jgi:hypothetical protein
MRCFLICSGLHGEVRGLEWLAAIVARRHPDGVLFAGGVLPLERRYAPRRTLWDLTHEDALFLKRFFHALGELLVLLGSTR